ncbi:MAG: thiolase family protein [Pseudomonadota bacterium]
MRDVFVIGIGMVRFGKFPDIWVEELGRKAILAAIKDSGVDPRRVPVAYCGHSHQGRVAGQRALKQAGISGIEVVNVENACAGGSTSFRQAYLSVASGLYDLALAVGMEKVGGGLLPPNPEDLDGLQGRVLPGHYAMKAVRHMYEYGTTHEQLAMVSVKSHRNASMNPLAQYQEPVTLDQVLKSRMVADPLTLLQCCPTGDGAAAAILCSRTEAARSDHPPVRVAGSAVRSGEFVGSGDDILESRLTRETAKKAYEMASVGPDEIDVCECHDAFTIGEILHCENLGFCPRGEGGWLIQEGKTEITGSIPVNPSGGLLSKGHPLGATGIAQVVEIVQQLRGQAGRRQVENARVGLTHTMGGAIPGLEAGACAVHIFMKE